MSLGCPILPFAFGAKGASPERSRRGGEFDMGAACESLSYSSSEIHGSNQETMTHLDTARHYLKAIEAGDAESVLSLFSPDAILEQLPNLIYPTGLRTTISEVPAAFEKGRKIFSRQTYEITNEAATGNLVALEVLWTGMLTIPFGTLTAGSEMRCHSAMFLEFRDGRIVAQRNYDCFDAW
jgi:ketosteroid isomerase-like protein